MTRKQKKMLLRIIISSVLLVALVILEKFIPIVNQYLRCIAYLVPYLVISYDILSKAGQGIVNGQVFDENFLMAVASLGAIAIGIVENGSYTEAVFVVLFYQIGELFQSYAVGKSRRNIASLMDIRPDYANLEIDGEITQVDPNEVPVGSIIVASAGERIAIDGVVIEGTTALDTSALTGESLPREIGIGDEVISGCINLSGTVRIRTTKEFGQSTVSKILDLVENSSSKKAKSEQFISRFARYYTPSVCGGALALAVLPPVISLAVGSSPMWSQWVYRALTFLVISCPCALVISIPLSFFAGIGGASKVGVLVKGSNYLEALSKAKIVAFDKTGTVTKGAFEVVEIEPNESISKDELLELSALAEMFSSHPISRALISAYGKNTDKSRIADVKEFSGFGISAIVDEKHVLAGNARFMESFGIEYDACEKTGTVVYVAVKGVYAGYILIADSLKPTSAEAISSLKKNGVERTVMLTGDNESTAGAIARELGVDSYYSQLLPDDKVDKVEELLSQKKPKDKLVFVGDGINDAPVLSRADIGIAMGALGSDAAIEAADIVLMDDDPAKITKAIRISRKCLRIVYENIYFALGIKALCLILGAFGIANMWLAIFADVGVMVIAVVNAIRALNTKKI